MAVRPCDSSADQTYFATPDINAGIYDGTSQSSASSPLNQNGLESLYGASSLTPYPAFPMQYPMNGKDLAPIGLIPVQLDIEGLYEDYNKRKKNENGKISSHEHSRRRAQNRASQRAFRDRKEKHMRELEQRLDELEGRHLDLCRSYESLQIEHSSAQQELEKLRKENARLEGSSGSSHNYSEEGEEYKSEILDPHLFDVPAFCFGQDEGTELLPLS